MVTEPDGSRRTARVSTADAAAEDAVARPESGAVSAVFADDRRTARRARDLVVELLRRVRWRGSVDDAALLVSEVTTNAILHARGAVRVSAEVDGEVLRVEVGDDTDSLPVPRVPSSESVSGRGLLVVERVARRWGTLPGPRGGKVVWFEL